MLFSTIAAVMLMFFCITKMFRGLDTSSTESGGIWNFISIAFYFMAAVMIFMAKQMPVRRIFIWIFLYSGIAMLASFWYTDVFDLAFLYNSFFIPYFGIVLWVFYSSYCNESCINTIFKITYYFALIISGISIIQYRMGLRERPLASDIYYTIGLFPFILLLGKSKKEKIVNFLLLFVITFLSGKRTGVLAVFCAMIVYMVIESWKNPKKRIGVILRVFLFAILCVLLMVFIDYRYNMGLMTRLLSIASDGGSGRIGIYGSILENYGQADLMHKLWGHGLFMTESLTGFLAHNDFLEILFDYGIFALIFFVLFYYELIRIEFKMIKRNSICSGAMGASIVIGMYLSMFSFFCIFYTYTTALTAFWGVALAIDEEERRNGI